MLSSAIAISVLTTASGGETYSVARLIAEPFLELSVSIAIGAVAAFLYSLISRNKRSTQELFGFSFILANMIFGIVVVNTQSSAFVQKIRDVLGPICMYPYSRHLAWLVQVISSPAPPGKLPVQPLVLLLVRL